MQFLNQSAYVIFSWLIQKKIPVILSRVSLQYNVKPNLILNTKFFISKFWCQDILYFFDDNIMGRIFTRYIFPYRHHVEITRKNKKKIQVLPSFDIRDFYHISLLVTSHFLGLKKYCPIYFRDDETWIFMPPNIWNDNVVYFLHKCCVLNETIV